jgi:hypothetical protein
MTYPYNINTVEDMVDCMAQLFLENSTQGKIYYSDTSEYNSSVTQAMIKTRLVDTVKSTKLGLKIVSRLWMNEIAVLCLYAMGAYKDETLDPIPSVITDSEGPDTRISEDDGKSIIAAYVQKGVPYLYGRSNITSSTPIWVANYRSSGNLNNLNMYVTVLGSATVIVKPAAGGGSGGAAAGATQMNLIHGGTPQGRKGFGRALSAAGGTGGTTTLQTKMFDYTCNDGKVKAISSSSSTTTTVTGSAGGGVAQAWVNQNTAMEADNGEAGVSKANTVYVQSNTVTSIKQSLLMNFSIGAGGDGGGGASINYISPNSSSLTVYMDGNLNASGKTGVIRTWAPSVQKLSLDGSITDPLSPVRYYDSGGEPPTNEYTPRTLYNSADSSQGYSQVGDMFTRTDRMYTAAGNGKSGNTYTGTKVYADTNTSMPGTAGTATATFNDNKQYAWTPDALPTSGLIGMIRNSLYTEVRGRYTAVSTGGGGGDRGSVVISCDQNNFIVERSGVIGF